MCYYINVLSQVMGSRLNVMLTLICFHLKALYFDDFCQLIQANNAIKVLEIQINNWKKNYSTIIIILNKLRELNLKIWKLNSYECFLPVSISFIITEDIKMSSSTEWLFPSLN